MNINVGVTLIHLHIIMLEPIPHDLASGNSFDPPRACQIYQYHVAKVALVDQTGIIPTLDHFI